MNLYMPEIFWHDRQGILSIDIQQKCPLKGTEKSANSNVESYKIATASVQREIRIWEFHFDRLKDDSEGKEVYHLSVNFIANLIGHESTTNVVRFSPNGKLLASGDVQGALIVWKISARDDQSVSPEKERVLAEKSADDFPPNRENWVRAFRVPVKHYGDVTCICWSPDSSAIASVATDDTISLHKADTGKPVWTVRSFRHYANGIAWDPRGKYLITLSTDRRLDILEAAKGNRLRSCHRVELPTFGISSNSRIVQQEYKIFHDDQLVSFMRGVEFSPCGSLVFAPAGHLEAEARNFYGSFVFKRADFDKCKPFAMIPSAKPTVMVKCSPIFYELRDDVKENFLQLPYRLIFAVLCKDSVFFYDSQFSKFFAYADSFQFNDLTNICWTPDGKVLVISSLEGYNTFFTLNPKTLGKVCAEQDPMKLLGCVKQPEVTFMEVDGDENQPPVPIILDCPDSPRLIQPKKSYKKKDPTATPSSAALDSPATCPSTAEKNLTLTANDGAPSFVIIKRKKPTAQNSSPASSPLSAKRKKETDPSTPLQDKKEGAVQKKINELW